MKYAPVRIIVLNRDVHFRRLVESLKKNSWARFTDVYVGVDFPPSSKYKAGWEKVIEYIEEGDFSSFKSFNVVKQERNMGVAANYATLAKLIWSKYDRMISLDDDDEVSPNFLEYMNKCLDYYENDEEVIAITGYSYPIDWHVSEGSTCLKQRVNAAAWGRGFWKSKMESISKYMKNGMIFENLAFFMAEEKYKNLIDASLREYILAATNPLAKKGFLCNCSDIGLRAYIGLNEKYCVSPVVSKVRNWGFDGSGVYCQDITPSDDGTTAGTYNYSKQPIDTAGSYELVPDTLHDHSENRKRLNIFDYRSPNQMARVHRLIWLMKNVGIWSAKLYTLLCLPYDYTPKVMNMIRKKLKR